MVIREAAGRDVGRLIADLASPSEVAREAAVARLAIIGSRAVERLGALAGSEDAPGEARAAALRALDAIGDPRALGPAARAAAAADVRTATAAIGLLRGMLRAPQGAAAVDALTAQALDRARDPVVRTAAIDALGTLDPHTRTPLWAALAADPDPAVRALVRRPRSGVPAGPLPALAAIAAGPLPDDPEALRRAIARAPTRTPLAALQSLVDRIREREAGAEPPQRAAWSAARAAAHVALAARNSRLALYDLREWLQRAEGPLPVDALAALERIGDESWLEPIAAAYARAAAFDRSGHDWWRQHLARAFRVIVARKHLTRRHAAVRRLAAKWAVAEELWPRGSRR